MKVAHTLLWLICHLNGNIACLMFMFCLCTASRASVKGHGTLLCADKILTVTQAITLLVFIQRTTAVMGKIIFLSLFLLTGQLVLGIGMFLIPVTPVSWRAAFMPLHVYSGLFIFCSVIAIALMGITEKLIFGL